MCSIVYCICQSWLPLNSDWKISEYASFICLLDSRYFGAFAKLRNILSCLIAFSFSCGSLIRLYSLQFSNSLNQSFRLQDGRKKRFYASYYSFNELKCFINGMHILRRLQNTQVFTVFILVYCVFCLLCFYFCVFVCKFYVCFMLPC